MALVFVLLINYVEKVVVVVVTLVFLVLINYVERMVLVVTVAVIAISMMKHVAWLLEAVMSYVDESSEDRKVNLMMN